MPRFYLHVVNRIGFAPDQEGTELADLVAAVEQTKEGIRSILSDEARSGRLDLNGRVEITDESGRVLQVVPFPDAFEIAMPAGAAYPGEQECRSTSR